MKMDEKEDAASFHDEKVKEFGELFEEISRILYLHDPLDVASSGAPPDEYDGEAAEIIPRLKDCKAPQDARKVLHEIFVVWCGPGFIGPEESFTEAAREVWQAWLRHYN